jgi:hypothetical protein
MNDCISAKDMCNLMMWQKVTSKQLRDMITTYDDVEYAAGLDFAMKRQWIRPARAGDHLVLTTLGLRMVITAA